MTMMEPTAPEIEQGSTVDINLSMSKLNTQQWVVIGILEEGHSSQGEACTTESPCAELWFKQDILLNTTPNRIFKVRDMKLADEIKPMAEGNQIPEGAFEKHKKQDVDEDADGDADDGEAEDDDGGRNENEGDNEDENVEQGGAEIRKMH